MYGKSYMDEEGEESSSYKIVDDINIPEATLAKRRLKLLADEVPLKRIGKAVFFLGDLIKLSRRAVWFIDSLGSVFRYTKSIRAKLIHRRIVNQFNIPSGGSILEVDGIASRFKCLYSPGPFDIYAGVLVVGMSYVLYGVYSEKHTDSWRMI